MATKKKPDEIRSVVFPAELHGRVTAEADKKQWSFSKTVVNLVRKALGGKA